MRFSNTIRTTPYPLAPSTSPWDTRDILEYGDDPTLPHMIATTMNGVEGAYEITPQRVDFNPPTDGQPPGGRRLRKRRHCPCKSYNYTTRAIPDTNQVLIFSIMSARRGWLLQAFSDGEHLIIQMTKLLSCEDKNSPFINHAFRYLMSEAIGDTSGLSDVTGIKAAV
jgi:hypothetical protein